jgi:hypothetical protein
MTPSLGEVAIDFQRLLETRLLIQANSGAGKSWCLRRVLEQTVEHVQQLIIDPDGEFPTLRERHDYIVCAAHGADAVANPQTAAALATALWKSGVSAVLDISELKAHERILFVRRFLETLINAPRAIWHPTLVVIDEIHLFCPQVGSAESAQAVIDIATRGRKRGLALLGATQRISKLHKDCAAELLNKAIGRTGLDIDVKRAADELGMANAREATEALRNLEPGEFYVYGPALSRAVLRTKIGPVETKHPETGKGALQAPPPPSAKVRAQLAKIEGLQRDAEAEAKTVESLSAELAKVRRELTIAQKPSASKADEAEIARRVSRGIEQAMALLDPPVPVVDPKLAKALREMIRLASAALGDEPVTVTLHAAPGTTHAVYPRAAPVRAVVTAAPASGSPEQRILDAIAWWGAAGVEHPLRHQVAFVANYTVNGHFNNLSGTLRTKGLIDYPSGGRLGLTDAGRAAAQAPERAPTRAELVARVTSVLKGEPPRRIFAILAERGAPLSRAELASAAGYTENGHFNNIVGSLNSIGVCDYPTRGMVGLSKIFDGLTGSP